MAWEGAYAPSYQYTRRSLEPLNKESLHSCVIYETTRQWMKRRVVRRSVCCSEPLRLRLLRIQRLRNLRMRQSCTGSPANKERPRMRPLTKNSQRERMNSPPTGVNNYSSVLPRLVNLYNVPACTCDSGAHLLLIVYRLSTSSLLGPILRTPTSPPTIVISIGMSLMLNGSTLVGSWPRTTRSASFPGVMEPFDVSPRRRRRPRSTCKS